MIEERIRNKNLLKKVVTPEVAARVVKDGMVIGASGGIYSALPKAFFQAVAERGRKGEIKEIAIWSIGLFGKEVEGVLAEAGIIKRRLGSHYDSTLRKGINSGKIQCNDIRTEMFSQYIRAKFFGELDLAVVDAIAITEEGHIIPSFPADNPSSVEMAKQVVVEINHAQPLGLEGMHDIYLLGLPPNQKEIPLRSLEDRIGLPYIPAGEDKIVYIVESRSPEKYPPIQPVDEASQKVADYLFSFLKEEINQGRLPKNLLPIEIGIGSIPDAVLRCLAQSEFNDLEFHSGILGDGVIEVIDAGKCKIACGGGLLVSKEIWERFCNNIEKYKEKIIFRNVEITNNPGIARRIGLLALNGALEIDIYGHINSSHIGGTQLMNGVGGQGVFASNAYLSVFFAFSTSRNNNVSAIVPMVPHVDITEHNVDVFVTEQGLADLRGLSPIERARKIIDNCAHPDYRPLLNEYLEKAQKEAGGHEPHILEEAFSFHERLKKTGTMKKQ